MEYMRPSNRESIESWANIWLACMDCTFYRGKAVSSTRAASDSDSSKFPSSLHQNFCGHGYDAGDHYRDHLHQSFQPGGTSMGGSPRERQTVAVRRHLAWRGKE